MKRTCQLTFRTSLGRNRVVSISDPCVTFNAAVANSVGNLILTANPFESEAGDLVSFTRAQIVGVTTLEVIAPVTA